MGSSITYPDGYTLTSTALTLDQINTLLQPMTLAMMGQDVDPNSGLVRIEWPSEGAPFATRNEDVCYLRCVPKDDPYNRIRDRSTISFQNITLTEQWNYTRAWAVRWCFYGPNSLDFARVIRSSLYQDHFTQLLSQSQLFPVPDFPEVVRAPELKNGQWFERVDFEAEMYEFVTETINRQTVSSVEVIVETAAGKVADITVT